MIPVVPYRVALSLTEPAVRCNVRCFNRQHYRQTSPLLTQPSGFKIPTQTQINWIPFGTRSIQAVVCISTFIIKQWNIYYMDVFCGQENKAVINSYLLALSGSIHRTGRSRNENLLKDFAFMYWLNIVVQEKKEGKKERKKKKGTEKKTFWMIQTKQTVRKSSLFLDVCITSIICVKVW